MRAAWLAVGAFGCAAAPASGPLPGVYPLVRAEDLDDLACTTELHKGAFEFADDGKVVARGDRDARVIETWKMSSQNDAYAWDLDSEQCTVTIPPVDAADNLPSWSCTVGDGQYAYDQGQYHMVVDMVQVIEGRWVAEDTIEVRSIERLLGCVDGDCFNWDGWTEYLGVTTPCDNAYGYRGTWDPDL